MTLLDMTVNVKNLRTAVNVVRAAVTGRSSLPILNHILIATEENGRVRLTGNDLELAISTTVNSNMFSDGSIAVPAKTILELLNALPDGGELSLQSDDKFTLLAKCNKSKHKLLSLNGEEYPVLPDLGDSVKFTMPQTQLRALIGQTDYAVSTDVTRAVLTGLMFEVEAGVVTVVATDTHRLSLKKFDIDDKEAAVKVNVPIVAAAQVMRLTSYTEGSIEITVSKTNIQFNLPGEDGVQIVSRLIEGQYPNYVRVIPNSSTLTAKIPTAALLASLKKIILVAREDANRVVLTFTNGNLKLSASSQVVGIAEDEIECECDGDIIIAFNVKFMQDALNVITADTVEFGMTESLKPAKVTVLGDDSFIAIFMPMQIVVA
jgi:DNA polymerase-3 subunit beta